MGFEKLPDWATKFNFTRHSPSAVNRPDDIEIFDRVIARPAGMFAPPNCNMSAGTAVEDYVNMVLVDALAPGEAFRHALAKLDEHQHPEHLPDDKDRMDLFRNGVVMDKDTHLGTHFELVCKNALEGVTVATKGGNWLNDGPRISTTLDGVKLPIVGEIDFVGPTFIELKTQWPYLHPESKQGWRMNSLPARPKKDHVRQWAIYWKWLREQRDNVPGAIVYANTKGYRIFTNENCEEMSESAIRDSLDDFRRITQAREYKLAKSEDVEELLQLIAPDFSFYQWRDKPPAYISKAKQMWGF